MDRRPHFPAMKKLAIKRDRVKTYSPHRPPHALHALYKRPRGTSHEFAISKLRAPSTEPLPSTPKEGLLRDWVEVAENLEMIRGTSMFPIQK